MLTRTSFQSLLVPSLWLILTVIQHNTTTSSNQLQNTSPGVTPRSVFLHVAIPGSAVSLSLSVKEEQFILWSCEGQLLVGLMGHGPTDSNVWPSLAPKRNFCSDYNLAIICWFYDKNCTSEHYWQNFSIDHWNSWTSHCPPKFGGARITPCCKLLSSDQELDLERVKVSHHAK